MVQGFNLFKGSIGLRLQGFDVFKGPIAQMLYLVEG